MAERPVSALEFQAAIGELRRKSDERHAENIQRISATDQKIDEVKKALDEHARKDLDEMNAVHAAVSENTTLTKEGNDSVEAMKKDLASLMQVFNSAKGAIFIGKGFGKFIMWGAGVAVSIAGIVGTVAYFLGRGPIPGMHY